MNSTPAHAIPQLVDLDRFTDLRIEHLRHENEHLRLQNLLIFKRLQAVHTLRELEREWKDVLASKGRLARN